jgi:glyoxylase-like metal-dependent hydrolase (beta-lactamase superfamily II)
MQILTQNGGLASTNCYLIVDETTKQAVLFDAPDHTVAPLLQEAKQRGYDLIGLWLTHGHFDHVADHTEVTRAFPNAKVLIHRFDVPKLRNPKAAMFPLPFVIPPREPDELAEDGQQLTIGSLQVEVIHTPGHAPGHVMYYFPNEKVLIGGDLIICGAVGRTDLPDSNERDLLNSIRKIMRLPDQTRLLPGHCSESTLAEERANNPFVREALGIE